MLRPSLQPVDLTRFIIATAKILPPLGLNRLLSFEPDILTMRDISRTWNCCAVRSSRTIGDRAFDLLGSDPSGFASAVADANPGREIVFGIPPPAKSVAALNPSIWYLFLNCAMQASIGTARLHLAHLAHHKKERPGLDKSRHPPARQLICDSPASQVIAPTF